MALFGIDVSTFQGRINWAQVKAAGVQFAIIRCGYGNDYRSQDDTQYQNNINGVTAQGLPYAIYIYSYANDGSGGTISQQVNSEADHAIRLARDSGAPYKPFCIYWDIEGAMLQLSDNQLKAYSLQFCNRVKAAGYNAGVYASSHPLDVRPNWRLSVKNSGYSLWVAQYSSSRPIWGNTDYDIWQYSSSGSVNGISGRVDVNYGYNENFILRGGAPSWNAIGWLDMADINLSNGNLSVAGWAYNQINDNAVSVLIKDTYVNKTATGTITANEYRQDLSKAGYGNGKHGFQGNIQLDNDFQGSKHTITAYAVKDSKTQKQLHGVRTINVPAAIKISKVEFTTSKDQTEDENPTPKKVEFSVDLNNAQDNDKISAKVIVQNSSYNIYFESKPQEYIIEKGQTSVTKTLNWDFVEDYLIPYAEANNMSIYDFAEIKFNVTLQASAISHLTKGATSTASTEEGKDMTVNEYLPERPYIDPDGTDDSRSVIIYQYPNAYQDASPIGQLETPYESIKLDQYGAYRLDESAETVKNIIQSIPNMQYRADNFVNDVQNIKPLFKNSSVTSQNQFATVNFLGSSISNSVANYLTSNAKGDPFSSKNKLEKATSFYNNGEEVVPADNDYAVVLNNGKPGDESEDGRYICFWSQYTKDKWNELKAGDIYYIKTIINQGKYNYIPETKTDQQIYSENYYDLIWQRIYKFSQMNSERWAAINSGINSRIYSKNLQNKQRYDDIGRVYYNTDQDKEIIFRSDSKTIQSILKRTRITGDRRVYVERLEDDESKQRTGISIGQNAKPRGQGLMNGIMQRPAERIIQGTARGQCSIDVGETDQDKDNLLINYGFLSGINGAFSNNDRIGKIRYINNGSMINVQDESRYNIKQMIYDTDVQYDEWYEGADLRPHRLQSPEKLYVKTSNPGSGTVKEKQLQLEDIDVELFGAKDYLWVKSGHPYFDIDYIPNENTVFNIEFALPTQSIDDNNDENVLFGCCDNTSNSSSPKSYIVKIKFNKNHFNEYMTVGMYCAGNIENPQDQTYVDPQNQAYISQPYMQQWQIDYMMNKQCILCTYQLKSLRMAAGVAASTVSSNNRQNVAGNLPHLYIFAQNNSDGTISGECPTIVIRQITIGEVNDGKFTPIKQLIPFVTRIVTRNSYHLYDVINEKVYNQKGEGQFQKYTIS